VQSAPNTVYGDSTPGQVCEGSPWLLDAATAAMPFPLLLPDHALANTAELRQVWKCSDTQVALEFSSGVVIYQEVNTLADPVAVWQRMAERYPEFSVATVRGNTASLADPTKAVGAEGGVDLVEGNVRIIVSGDGKIPLTALVEVTESLRKTN
jgi:hypothetical protein